MIIKRTAYEKLLNRSKLADELEAETKRLAKLITLEVKDCKMGVWCKECVHVGYDHSEITEERFSYKYTLAKGGGVCYCKKHLHEICPEFTKR